MKSLLEKRNRLYRELVTSQNELIMNAYIKLRIEVNYTIQFMKRLHFSNNSLGLSRNEFLVSKQISQLS